MTNLLLNPAALVFADGENLKTDSRKVAKAFGKRHDNVIRAIEKLECTQGFAVLNFEVCHEISNLQNGKPSKFYSITREGAMMLIMGFTGKKAALIKEAFVTAFKYMEQQIGFLTRYTQICQIEEQEKVSASGCGRGLNAWKGIKREIDTVKDELEAKLQPDLFVGIGLS
ncbi:Rha family transcriptional regulator [Neisseriaceae bacterium CLB008]